MDLIRIDKISKIKTDLRRGRTYFCSLRSPRICPHPQHDLRIREWAEIADFSLIFYLFGNFSNFQIAKKSTYRSEVQRNDSHDSDFFIIFKHHTKIAKKMTQLIINQFFF